MAYVACEPYFDIATGKLANDVPMDVNDNNASTSSSGCSPKIEQCCFVSPFVSDESLRFSLLALAHLFIPVPSAAESMCGFLEGRRLAGLSALS